MMDATVTARVVPSVGEVDLAEAVSRDSRRLMPAWNPGKR